MKKAVWLSIIPKLVLIALVSLSASCAKESVEFHLFFFPPGTGLKNNDWQRFANVNIVKRSAGLLSDVAKEKIMVSFRESGAKARLVFEGKWSEASVENLSGN